METFSRKETILKFDPINPRRLFASAVVFSPNATFCRVPGECGGCSRRWNKFHINHFRFFGIPLLDGPLALQK